MKYKCQDKLPVSIVVLTYNEERNIEECLKSVCDWAGELFVVDSYSDDKTLEIVSKYTDKIIQHEFDYHAAQKNWALEELPFENDWVLLLDADEKAITGIKTEVARILEKPDCDGYYIPRKNYFMGKWIKHGGWYPDWQLRFFKHKLGRYEDRIVHEHIILYGSIGYLKNALLHYDFKGFERYFDRHNKYSSCEAVEAFEILLKRNKERIKASFFKGGPHRRRWIKQMAYRYVPFRPLLKFIYMYFLKLGFIDGTAGFHYCMLHTFYEYQVNLKLKELKKGDSPLIKRT